MFDHLEEWISANWGKAVGALAFLAFIPAYIRARYLWRKRRFLTRINFSINFVEGDTLKFRTLRETNLADAMLNNVHAVRVILKAPRHGDPGGFLLFKDKEEARIILTTLLNELSAGFAEGFVARSMGLPTRSEWFDIALTCEKHADLKATKFRVMMISRKILQNIDKFDPLQFEQPHHRIRLATLKQMRQIAQDESLKHNIMQIELTVRD